MLLHTKLPFQFLIDYGDAIEPQSVLMLFPAMVKTEYQALHLPLNLVPKQTKVPSTRNYVL